VNLLVCNFFISVFLAVSSEQNDKTINKRDCEFVDALNHLRNKRHLLTTTEEGFIISLADKFKHY